MTWAFFPVFGSQHSEVQSGGCIRMSTQNCQWETRWSNLEHRRRPYQFHSDTYTLASRETVRPRMDVISQAVNFEIKNATDLITLASFVR